MLKGIYISKIDKWGRVRIPKALRRTVETKYGNKVFVTTINGETALIYPLQEWEKVEEEIRKNDPKNSLIMKFIIFTSYFGKLTKIDKQGRVLIHSLLRKKTNLKDKIIILGKVNCLEIMDFQKRLV